jgi:hypothetical protein
MVGMSFFLFIAAYVHSLFKIQVTPTIDTGKPGAPPATRNAQAIGEAPTGIACRPPVLGYVLEVCRRMAGYAARIAPRYRCTLASAGLPLLLALEESRP